MIHFTKLAKAALATTAFVALGTAAHAGTLVFAGGTGGLTGSQTNYADFDTTFGSYTTTGTAGIISGTSGAAAEPAFGDQGDAYFYVSGGGSATFSFGDGVNQFGFDLGSADDYNTLIVNYLDGTSQSFMGAMLNPPGPATGNQDIAGTNGRVTVFGNGQLITGAQFVSGQPSFELDNIGIAVPEPSTWALFILGFGFLGGAMRRRAAKAGAVHTSFA